MLRLRYAVRARPDPLWAAESLCRPRVDEVGRSICPAAKRRHRACAVRPATTPAVENEGNEVL